ncbi:MAG: hypothetical protein JJE50_08965 [Actinomycetales bacterium]|nr:hypothetical protein [Actinomycetales bacterium]
MEIELRAVKEDESKRFAAACEAAFGEDLHLDHPCDDDDEDDPHENPDPDRYVHLFLLSSSLESGQSSLSPRILASSLIV